MATNDDAFEGFGGERVTVEAFSISKSGKNRALDFCCGYAAD